MADDANDIASVLKTIGQKSGDVTELTRALKEFDKAKTKAMKAGDIKALTVILQLEKATHKLRLEEEKRLKLQKRVQEAGKQGIELSEDERKAIAKNTEEIARNQAVLMEAAKSQTRVHEQAVKEAIELREASIKNFRENTKLGKAFALADNALAKYAAGLTFASLAMKAYSRYTEAAETRQQILIQSFRGFSEPMEQMAGSAKDAGRVIEGTGLTIGMVFGSTIPGSVAKSVASFYNTQKAIFAYNEAITKAEVTAHRMGVSIDVVRGTMADFARLTGNTAPEALGKLTEGAIAISRSMGLTVPEAVDFVSTRMDKFGGTAASALIALNELRVESERINNAFGRTVIRGDDLAKTLQSISSQTTVYAIDQRVVGSILRDNIARLQASGESYDNARKKAENFAEALAGGKAPEWMQVLAGEDLVGEMRKAFGKGGEEGIKAFQAKFGDSLDAAKPGLSKRVQEILGSIGTGPGKRNAYEAMRLVQELTQGTSVGIDAMNRQLIKLADSTGNSVEVIAKQMNVSRDVADGMLKQARAWEQEQGKISEYAKMTPEQLAKSLKISEATAKTLLDSNQTEEEKKKSLGSYLKLQNESLLRIEEENRLKAEAEAYNKKRVKTEAEIANWKKLQDVAVKEGRTDEAKNIGEIIKSKQAELAQMISDAAARREKAEELNIQLGQVGSITEELKEKFLGYSVASGNYFKELFAKLGTMPVLIGAAVTVGAFKMFKVFGRLESKLADLAAINESGFQNVVNAVGGDKGGRGGEGEGKGKGKGRKGRRGGKGRSQKTTVKPKGRAKRLFEKAAKATKKVGRGVKGLSGRMLTRGAGSLVKGSAIGGLVTLATNYDKIIEAAQAGSVKEAVATLAPAIGSAIGSTVGGLAGGALGSALGPGGTVAGGIAGGAAGANLGESVGESLKKWLEETDAKAPAATEVVEKPAEPRPETGAVAEPRPEIKAAEVKPQVVEKETISRITEKQTIVETKPEKAPEVAIPNVNVEPGQVNVQVASPETAPPVVIDQTKILPAEPVVVVEKERREPVPQREKIIERLAPKALPPPPPAVKQRLERSDTEEDPFKKWMSSSEDKRKEYQSGLTAGLAASAMKSAADRTEISAPDPLQTTEPKVARLPQSDKPPTILKMVIPEPKPATIDMKGLVRQLDKRETTSSITQMTKPDDLMTAMQPRAADFAPTAQAAQPMATPAPEVAATPTAATTGGPLPAEFGSLSPDGSILLKVSNFMQAFAQGQAMSRNRIRTSG